MCLLAHSKSIQADAALLECDPYICAHDEVDNACWLGANYREMGVTPPYEPPHVLVSAFVKSGKDHEAREYLCRIMQLKCTLHERHLYQ